MIALNFLYAFRRSERDDPTSSEPIRHHEPCTMDAHEKTTLSRWQTKNHPKNGDFLEFTLKRVIDLAEHVDLPGISVNEPPFQ
jgi:hypothetical protein